jgi:hypothetical protein
MDHEVLDFPRMIAKLERMNLNQENPKEDPEKNYSRTPERIRESIATDERNLE